MSVDARQGAQGSRHPARAPQRRDGASPTTPRSRRPSATRAGCARSTRSARRGWRPASAASSTSASRASSASRWRSSSPTINPTSRADQPAQPAPGHEVRRPRLHGPVGGREVDRDLPPDPPRRAVPPLRRPRREPRRAAAAGRQGRPQRRDDGQLPDDARHHARGGPRDVRGARPQRRAASPTTAPTRGPTTARAGWTARRPTSSTSLLDAERRRTLDIRLWDPSTQLRFAKKATVPPRPDGAPNRCPGSAQRSEARQHDRHRGAPATSSRSSASTAGMRHDQRAAGPARRARRQAGAAAVLEQLPRARRPPARARGGGRRGDALGRRRGRVAAGLGQR